jgi:alginate O-acetyltransferase complex protein AlgI
MNLMITMLLGGLWHGAAWNFVFWGLLHGIYLSGHRLVVRDDKPAPMSIWASPHWAGDIIKIFVTFHLVALTWVFFRSPDLTSALIYLRGLSDFYGFRGLSGTVIFAGFLMFSLDVAQRWSGSHTWLADGWGVRPLRYMVGQLLVVSVLAAAIAHVQTMTPFIYFQF